MAQLQNIMNKRNHNGTKLDTQSLKSDQDIVETVVYKKECKHGTRWEWCGVCQKVEFTYEVECWFQVRDKETGNLVFREDGSPVMAKVMRKCKGVTYKRWR